MINRQFVHLSSGKIYILLFITNHAATKPEYIPQAVYMDVEGNIWSRSLSEFEEKFAEVVY